jgi:hypothetical protein
LKNLFATVNAMTAHLVTRRPMWLSQETTARAGGPTVSTPKLPAFDGALSRTDLLEARGASFDVALSGTELREARGASFDVGLSGTKLLEARGASRGNAVCGSDTRFPSACASGFEANGGLVKNVNTRHEDVRLGFPLTFRNFTTRDMPLRVSLELNRSRISARSSK